MEALLQPPEFSSVKWLKGVTVDDSAPKYLIPSQRRRGQLNDANFSTLEVRIGDLGGGKKRMSVSNLVWIALLRLTQAQYVQRRDEKPVTPLGLRAPELLQHTRDTSIDTTLDIWALGCLVCQRQSLSPIYVPSDTSKDIRTSNE